jgi:hypothetical protein
MRKQFVKGCAALVVATSFAACVAPEDSAPVAESESELGLDSTLFDTSTACTVGGVRMHCCPDGFAMTGIHVDDNVLRCSRLQVGFSGPTTLDAGTVRNGMHACPSGQLMVGIHVDRNLLSCRPSGQAIGLEFVDAVTTDSFVFHGSRVSIHVCPNTFAMAGIHVDNNQFTCDQ